MAAEAQTLEQRITSLLAQMTTEERSGSSHHEGDSTRRITPAWGFPDSSWPTPPRGARRTRHEFSGRDRHGLDLGPRSCQANRRGDGEGIPRKGETQGLGPCLDIDRDPRNGRTPETGEKTLFVRPDHDRGGSGDAERVRYRDGEALQCQSSENGRTSNNIIASQRILHDLGGFPSAPRCRRRGAVGHECLQSDQRRQVRGER